MTVTALPLYEQLTEAPDEKAKARIIAEAFGQLEERYPQGRSHTAYRYSSTSATSKESRRVRTAHHE